MSDRPLSPLERLIDSVTGYDPKKPRLPYTGPMLRCPTCSKEQATIREKTDPKGTKVTLLECPACFGDREPKPAVYLDKDGNELKP